MNEKGEFIYNDVPCSIMYNDKNFYLAVFKDDERIFTKEYIHLFPVPKFSKGQQRTAFIVANLHVLKNLIK